MKNPASPEVFAERFWGRVDQASVDGCWPWSGARIKGYGVVWRDGKNAPAHRVAYELANGVTLSDDVKVLHRCDNPPCCRPSHLFEGTSKINAQDMVRKGRHRNQLVTHCPRGHEYTPENTRVDAKGHRWCRACKREREALVPRKTARRQGTKIAVCVLCGKTKRHQAHGFCEACYMRIRRKGVFDSYATRSEAAA